MRKSRKSKVIAKQVGIELWQYLADHPEMSGKYQIEDERLMSQMERYLCDCPLCEFYNDSDVGVEMTCKGCPLAEQYGPCSTDNPKKKQHPFLLWGYPNLNGKLTEKGIINKRRKNALKILEVMKGWNVE